MGRKKSVSPPAHQGFTVDPKYASVGPPRFDKYDKILKRFYEHLLVLYQYDPVRGDHTTETREPGLGGFLDDLAFLCEYKKGGDACTAIGIEDSAEYFAFWVAANVDVDKRIAPFLEDLLTDLVGLSRLDSASGSNEEHQLMIKCMTHARLKIKSLRDLLFRAFLDCHKRTQNPIFMDWRGRFDGCPDDLAMCELAYELRRSDEMGAINAMDQEPAYTSSPTERKSPFGQVRHYIGRLAHYIRVARRLVQDLSSTTVTDLIDNPFRVKSIPTARCVSLPRPDSHTTLDGICVRMLEARDPFLDQLKHEFANRNIFEKIMTFYENDKAPRVHAEIQVLDFFHTRELRWASNNRYVGCSKAACFCCQRYFRHHPARPKEPQSHQKVWPLWGPMSLELGSKDARFVEQRNILQSIVADIRKDLIGQIKAGHRQNPWHEDTRTDITSSVTDPVMDSLGSLASQLSNVHIDSSGDQDDRSTGHSETSSSEQVASDVASVPIDDPDDNSYSSDTSTDEDCEADGGALL